MFTELNDLRRENYAVFAQSHLFSNSVIRFLTQVSSVFPNCRHQLVCVIVRARARGSKARRQTYCVPREKRKMTVIK